jgi:multidrug efflux pump subunit AcrB
MALLLVFAILLFEFGTFRPPVVIVLVQIMSALGVFALLRVTGTALNISSMLGLVMIVGIVAENAIFLFHYAYLFQRQGLPLRESLIEAGLIRSRPILMTTLVAVLALMPLAVGWGFGAQLQKPLAIAIIGGFSLSSVLLLYALPIFFATYAKPGSGGQES